VEALFGASLDSIPWPVAVLCAGQYALTGRPDYGLNGIAGPFAGIFTAILPGEPTPTYEVI
jgi:hypothetical protein